MNHVCNQIIDAVHAYPDAAERAELLTLLERELRETHVEARRTESPDYQDEVHHQEAVLQSMLV